MDGDQLFYFGTILIALIISIPLHEFGHAMSAVSNGDEGPRREGRLSLLPWDHFDILGFTFCCIASFAGVGLGWGKPVMVNPHALNNPRWDIFKITLWGPTMNLILAVLFAIPLRLGLIPEGEVEITRMLYLMVRVNVGLMIFNLLPIAPLDGARLVEPFLPESVSVRYMQFQQMYGGFILIALVFVGRDILHFLIWEPVRLLMGALTGI